jgi:adenosylmethionine-8-amino-7-oxononanoate aminotransferase
MNNVKALVIQMPLEVDLHNVIQVARAEGMKLYKTPGKIKVLDMVSRPYGWIVVVQNGDGCISEQAKSE